MSSPAASTTTQTTPSLKTPSPSTATTYERAVSPATASKLADIEASATAAAMADPLPRSEVLSREIPWDSYMSGWLMTPQELELIKSVDKKPFDARRAVYDDAPRAEAYAATLVSLLRKVSVADTLQYVLAMLGEALGITGDQSLTQADRVGVLAKCAGADPAGALVALLTKRATPDWFVCKEASAILARVAVSRGTAQLVGPEHRTALVGWAVSLLSSQDAHFVRVALGCLRELLGKSQEYRLAFAQANGLTLLQRVVECNTSVTSFQVLYETLVCAWLALYSREVLSAQQAACASLVPCLVNAIRYVDKDKVRRAAVAALKNLLPDRECRQRMVACGLHRLTPTLLSRKWGDQEITDDLEALDAAVSKEVLEMSSWDVFRSEVTSGSLSWTTPVHRSERFWRENVAAFEEGGTWQVLGRLQEIVRSSKDKQALAVACWDLGEFVQYHPRGRSLLNQMNVKQDLMQLLLHDDDTVRKNALYALQKLLAHKVEYIGA